MLLSLGGVQLFFLTIDDSRKWVKLIVKFNSELCVYFLFFGQVHYVMRLMPCLMLRVLEMLDEEWCSENFGGDLPLGSWNNVGYISLGDEASIVEIKQIMKSL